MLSDSVTIIQDTREQQPWHFMGDSRCAAQIIEYLPEGDYTLEAYPNLVCVERKKSVSEIASNLGKYYTRFRNEMERLRKYRFRYVVCEFTEEQMLIYPNGSKLPKWVLRKIKIGGKFLHRRIQELTDDYEIEFIFCEDKFAARDKAMELLLLAKEVYDKESVEDGC